MKMFKGKKLFVAVATVVLMGLAFVGLAGCAGLFDDIASGKPVVVIASPANNTITTNSTILITGTATIADSGTNSGTNNGTDIGITINEIGMSSNNSAYFTISNNLNQTVVSWSFTALLKLGTNTFTARAASSEGVLGFSDMLTVIYDDGSISSNTNVNTNGLPVALFSDPLTNITVTNSYYYVQGTAYDIETYVSNLTLRLNGSPITNWNGMISVWGATVGLSYGFNLLEVYCFDSEGNISLTNSVEITYDTNGGSSTNTNNAPTLSITIPSGNITISNTTYTIAGMMSDDGWISNVYYQVNGGGYSSVSDAASFHVAWTNYNTALSIGSNYIEVYAVDNDFNNSSVDSVWIYVETNGGSTNTNGTNPTLSITIPSGNITISNTSYTIAGMVSDDGCISNVYYQVNGGGYSSVNASSPFAMAWTNFNTPLSLGSNFIEVYAVDNDFNNSPVDSVWIYVETNGGSTNTNDTIPPTVTITDPAGGYAMVSNSTYTVLGTASDNVSVWSVRIDLNYSYYDSIDYGYTNDTNSFVNLNFSVSNLVLGTNTIKVYAMDNSTNDSATNTAIIYRAF